MPPRVFLLSPALLTGVRGRRILAGEGDTALVRRLRDGASVPLGDVYTAISSLYYRGKRTYARRFGRRSHGRSPTLVVTPCRGLLDDATPVDLATLAEFASVAVDPADPAYAGPLGTTAAALARELAPDGEAVLLGSLATPKYLAPLGAAAGLRLRVPRSFVGTGDMRRGSLLLRAVEAGTELDYVDASDVVTPEGR